MGKFLRKIIPTLKTSPSKIHPKNYGRNINRIVIHCTGSTQEATVESILKYFKVNLGWKSPGYHYMISPNGDITNTWPINKVSNGVRGYNYDSVHISYIGGEINDNRTPLQKISLKKLINDLREDNNLGKLPVVGHRDLSPDLNGDGVISKYEWVKRCPSFDVKNWLKEENIL